MGIAADFFFSTDAERETLHRRITPSADQFENQKNRWNDLASFLQSRMREDTGIATRTWLQGSYKFGTQIRPWSVNAQFDIDMGLYFEWEGCPEDGKYEPEQLKTLVQLALLEYQSADENDATGVEEPKERCCRIAFNPDFHIDVPCYHLDQAHDSRTLATESKGWEKSDPKAIYRWFKERYDDAARRGQMRRQVRYLKMWAALNFKEDVRPSSILLTVLVADALETYDIEGVQDDELLEHVAIVVHRRLSNSQEVLNPINSEEDLNRLGDAGSDNLIERLADLVSLAQRVREAQDRGAAAAIWAEAFGQFFPMPEDNDEVVAKTEGTRSALSVYNFDPKIEIIAVPQANKHRNWRGLNELPVIPKECDITFRLVNADQLPRGATLRWTVRNHGDEAIRLNDLGHSAGSDIEIKEHSAYNGNHAVDLTVYLGSHVIGRRRTWVKIRGMAMPARNRARRQFLG